MRNSSAAAKAHATSTSAKKPQAGPLNSNPSSGGTTTAAVSRRMARLLFTRGTDLSRRPQLHKYFRNSRTREAKRTVKQPRRSGLAPMAAQRYGKGLLKFP